MAQVIKRALLTAFNPASYTASVLLLEATSTELTDVPIAFQADGSSTPLNGSLCAVLFFDEHNASDAVVLAVYSTGSVVPTPAPGRVTFVPGYRQINGDVLSAGSVSTYTLSGGSSGIPSRALGVLYKAYYSSSTLNSYVQLAPHGASDLSAYATLGNTVSAGAAINGAGLLALDAQGRIDVKAQVGSCTLTLYTYGYVI
ncbi:hypothetical protein [Dictyobacter aurantiacus]|uniref:Uncharacterized protein n=1 Tax=Dictyobacter aurantiacus TaxID=1936993 RepID=A0A401ZKG8_9CHLR|nr:hypothetical protein [Dictyobacter aurantiacus]GCE07367.1 hypothetical protein KDAU_46960 [Dictyobacter aurantiacus]